MNTLRQAVQEYLTLRRNLGFKLSKPGKLLPAFVKFMEQHRASHITTKLALAWAQQPSTVQPAEWAYRLSVVQLCAPSECNRPTNANSSVRFVAVSPQASSTIPV